MTTSRRGISRESIFTATIVALVFAVVAAAFWAASRRRRAAEPVPSPAEIKQEDPVDDSANIFRCAFVAFTDSELAIWREATKDSNFRLEAFSRDEFPTATVEDCDLVVIRAIGWTPSEEDRAKVRSILEKTHSVGYTQTLDFAREATNIGEDRANELYEYFFFPCEENARRGAAFMALNFGKESAREIFQNTADAPNPLKIEPLPALSAPNAGFFHKGPQISETFADFEKRRAAEGRSLPEDAPRIALFGDFLDPFKEIDRRPVDEIIAKLEAKGFVVYPIYKIQRNPDLLRECRPDLGVYFPRGRVLPGGNAAELFEELGIPVLTAALLMTTEEEWRTQPIGATGSYYSLATALPELDGAIEPIALGTKDPDENGLVVRKPLSERIDAFVRRCEGWINLQRKSNADKKVALFYYKSPGSSALAAQSLDVVPSLYNTLLKLREEGYDLGSGFPESPDALGALIEKRGRTVGQWTLGDFQQFVRDAEPAVLSEAAYGRLFREHVPEKAQKEMIETWGPAPGEYMTADVGDEYGIVVPRITFGNVAILPQPTTDVMRDAPYDPQGNELDAVHGTEKAIPHFYAAAYLWARRVFGADALVHFGTHGSLEFTRGKTGFLTESCFPDLLIGDVPHVYLYSINNIGEAFLAKRRARAVIVSHLTPPFMTSGLSGDLETLDEKVHEYAEAEDPALRSEYAVSIADVVLSSGLIDDLTESPEFAELRDQSARDEFLAARKPFAEEQIEILHALLHRYEYALVTNGLHVLGRPWTDEQIAETAAASKLDDAEAQTRLRASFDLELDRFCNALSGRFVPPSTGGDFLANPDAAPTGRNLAGLDAQRLPSVEAERVAARLTDELLANYRANNDGRWPRKVACTLWGGETTRTQGVGIAQALALLGVRVKRDSRGAASELELVPTEELGRPRIDVLIQTSGQFRDSFGSRIELIDQGVRMAASAEDGDVPNFVRENSLGIEERLISEQGLTQEDARELSTARVFGATDGLSYGTGIMRLVERGDLWETEEQIADRYIANMSGVYRSAEHWGKAAKGALEYSLEGLDLAVQTRSSNVWGPAKLDHVYEFATLATAARVKSGRDPEIWFDDLRAQGEPRVQSSRAAIREELRSTLWNPKYLAGLQREGATAAESVMKTTRNIFGWSVAQPALIDDSIWEETSSVLVDDARGLGLREWFEEKNPGALQDLTAVMLEAIRKGRWNASEETRDKLANFHAELVAEHGLSGSYESSGNARLHEFIGSLLPESAAAEYAAAIQKATVPALAQIEGLGLVEVKDEPQDEEVSAPAENWRSELLALAVACVACAGFFLSGFMSRR